MAAYYNEFDPYAAQWLRNLIAAGHIAPGDVDERSIEDVHPDDLKPYTQCHFFAGVGVWSYALRRAGWPDDRPVWTGSCPCQPFSAAGARAGFDDQRHLWPHFHWLISQRQPAVVFGEQVASKDAEPWLDLVQTDLEAMDYAFGAVAFPSASVGAPHIRDRTYWVADASNERFERRGPGQASNGRSKAWLEPERLRDASGMDYPAGSRRQRAEQIAERETRHETRVRMLSAGHGQDQPRPAGPVNGLWAGADWLFCRDGKWRPVEPGLQQMVDGSSGSLGRVCPGTFEEAEQEVNEWSIRHQEDPAQSLHRVWCLLQQEALSEREIGRFSGVQSPAVLLAFLRQLAEQGWRFADSMAYARPGTSQAGMRVMRFDSSSARTPLRRELAEQFAGQPADPLRELSSILAHHAAKCWGVACGEKAGAASFPLAEGAPARVGRLRAYGNAINAEAAAQFIAAYLETLNP